MLGVIYAEEGKTVRAALIWRELVREVPAYEPARANLALLGIQTRLPLGVAVISSGRPSSKWSRIDGNYNS